ncbi:MAG TPA: LamG-like jellyroll fold domain-containing protein [Verrucomicrobiae bacterium]
MKSRLLPLCAALALSLGSAFGQVTANQIYTGLVSYWPMDQLATNSDTGAVTTPDVISGLSLTAMAGPTNVAGQFGNAIYLNGTNEYLVNTQPIPGTNNLATGAPYFDGKPYTVAMWLKVPMPTSVTHYVWAMASTTNNNPLMIVQTGSTATTESNLDCIIRNVNGTAVVNHTHTTNALFDGNWHHFAWVDSNGVVSVYQDGVLESSSIVFSYWPSALINMGAETGSTFPYNMAMNTFAIGALQRATSAGYLTGAVDDAAVWNRALSQGEVQFVMSNSIAMPAAPQPPSFTVPWNGQTNSIGDYVTLNANAIGTPPLSLQWYENGAAISGATNEILSLPVYNNTMTSAGSNSIYVTASNPNGTVSSVPAPLVVLPDPAPELSLGCFGYWPSDTIETNAIPNNTPDIYLANNFNLTNMTGGSVVPGVFSNALSFNSASLQNGYLDGIVPAFNYTNYSISYWVNGQGAGTQVNTVIFDNASSSQTTTFLSFGTTLSAAGPATNLACYVRSDQNQAVVPFVLSSNSVMDGNWHHVVWVDKSGTVTLYVDGVMDPAAFSYIRTNATPTLRSNLTWAFNSEALACSWRGKAASQRTTCEMDDVAWWDRALSYTEVQQLQTNAVPAPSVITSPSYAAEPPALLTNQYVGDTVSIGASAVGSPPISYQWYYNAASNYSGTAIPSASNPTATNSVLTLTDAQLTNSGYYYLVASNGVAPGSGQSGGGKTNSSIVQLAVNNYGVSPTNANSIVLKLEFNAVATPADIAPGFQTMTLAMPSVVYNGTTKVTLSAIGGAVLTDRDRNTTAEPNTVTNNPPALNTALVYNSFIFDDVETGGSGIDLLIEHLAPSTAYNVEIWSFDPASTPSRYSDWTEAISGTVFADPYVFNGAVQPAADNMDTINAVLFSSPDGQLDIQSVMDALSVNSQFSVFINAIEIIANPSPIISSSSGSITNGYNGDTQTFSVAATGAPPLSYQWYYDSNAISLASNPSAGTNVLVVPNSQAGNDGYYYVVISNQFGVVTSSPVQLEVVGTYSPPPTNANATVLKLEFNAVATPGNVQPGYQSMTLAQPSEVFNGTTRVTVSALNNGTLADRDRNTTAPPGTVSNSPPDLTTAFLYNSFIFDNFENGVTATGLDLLIQHLAPNTVYGVNIWSFDPVTTPLRAADWTEATSGAFLAQYAFNGANLPLADGDDTFGALLQSSPSGTLDLQGVADQAYLADVDVFINAIVISANPTPQMVSSGVNPVDGYLLLKAAAQYSGQSSIVFQESPDLKHWQNAIDGVNPAQHGAIYSMEFPISGQLMYYRVVYQPLGPQ